MTILCHPEPKAKDLYHSVILSEAKNLPQTVKNSSNVSDKKIESIWGFTDEAL